MKSLVLKTVRHNFQVLALIVSTTYAIVARHAPYVAILLASLAIVLAPLAIVAAIVLLQPQGIALALLLSASFAACCAIAFAMDYLQRH
jgi:hypothetical protein